MTSKEKMIEQGYVPANQRPACRNCFWRREHYSDTVYETKAVTCGKGCFRVSEQAICESYKKKRIVDKA